MWVVRSIKVIGLKDEQRQTITFSQDNAVVDTPKV